MTLTDPYPAPDATAQTREHELRGAQDNARALFERIDAEGLVRPGVDEVQLSNEIKSLAADQLGVTRYWHKRVVRAGRNTLHPYDDNPPVRVIEEDDIVFLDLGPIFAEWEADFGRTFVLGDDPLKLKIKADIEEGWHACKAFFDATPECTGAQLYAFAVEQATSRGWQFGGSIAGHLLGEFPHEKLDDDEIESYVLPANDTVLRSIDPYGRPRHWICEIHFVDREREIGGFFEQLLTID
ncbi:M24 family metallopeptidase [uncultured Jatrophihabitans sp.]|uniref:M24 family metallopeptidase n=1 Tax=uncultured Jatrophihabitans sp. TaxID=1610747 RepID=UPI0035CB2CFD